MRHYTSVIKVSKTLKFKLNPFLNHEAPQRSALIGIRFHWPKRLETGEGDASLGHYASVSQYTPSLTGPSSTRLQPVEPVGKYVVCTGVTEATFFFLLYLPSNRIKEKESCKSSRRPPYLSEAVYTIHSWVVFQNLVSLMTMRKTWRHGGQFSSTLTSTKENWFHIQLDCTDFIWVSSKAISANIVKNRTVASPLVSSTRMSEHFEYHCNENPCQLSN